MQNFNILSSLRSWAGLFEPYLVKNCKEKFSRIKAHIRTGIQKTTWSCLADRGPYKASQFHTPVVLKFSLQFQWTVINQKNSTAISIGTGISVEFHWTYGHFASTQDFSAYHISKQQRLGWVCSNDWNFSGRWNFSLNTWPLCLWIHKISVLTTSVSSKGSDKCVQMTEISVGTGISVKFHWIYGHIANAQDFSAYHTSKQQRLRQVCKWLEF